MLQQLNHGYLSIMVLSKVYQLSLVANVELTLDF